MLILTDKQEVDLSVAFTSKAGNPAKVDGTPAWVSSNEAVVTVVAAADGLSVVAKAVGPLGTAQVSVSADADLGEGVRLITGTFDITVEASEAVVAGVAAGTPRDQAPVEPPAPPVEP